MGNSFNILSGVMPESLIERPELTEEIIRRLTVDPHPSHIVMLGGVHGSGKTVMRKELAARLGADGWHVIEAGSVRDIYEKPDEVTRQHTDPETRVLVTLDDAENSAKTRDALRLFTDRLSGGRVIFLLMTGQADRLHYLRNKKSLAFMSDAPLFMAERLDTSRIAEAYRRTLDIPPARAEEMATLTDGFPYAFQLLGYLYETHYRGAELDELLYDYDEYLGEYVYEKIRSELSVKDRSVLSAMAEAGPVRTRELCGQIRIPTRVFYTYRKRLERSGLVYTDRDKRLCFTLPRFDVFMKEHP